MPLSSEERRLRREKRKAASQSKAKGVKEAAKEAAKEIFEPVSESEQLKRSPIVLKLTWDKEIDGATVECCASLNQRQVERYWPDEEARDDFVSQGSRAIGINELPSEIVRKIEVAKRVVAVEGATFSNLQVVIVNESQGDEG